MGEVNAGSRLRVAGWVSGVLIATGLLCVAASAWGGDAVGPSADAQSVDRAPSATSSREPFISPATQPREIGRVTEDSDVVISQFVEIPANTAVSALFACTGSVPVGWSATAEPSGDPIVSMGDLSCDGNQSTGTVVTRQPDAQAIEIQFIGAPASDTRAYVILLAG